jgi:ubiquitin C-terminal hydrolase
MITESAATATVAAAASTPPSPPNLTSNNSENTGPTTPSISPSLTLTSSSTTEEEDELDEKVAAPISAHDVGVCGMVGLRNLGNTCYMNSVTDIHLLPCHAHVVTSN